MPTKPDSLPEGARWSDHDNEWVLGTEDEEGRKQGLVKYYRPDGTLCCATEYVDNKPHGSFSRYHENGEPSRTGEFVDGSLQGTNVFTRCDEETSETFPPNYSSTAIWRCDMDYVDGRVEGTRLFNRDGRQLQDNGVLLPVEEPEERPAPLPAEARWDPLEPGEEWVVGSVDDDGERHGPYRAWNAAGVLHCECHFEHGKLHGSYTNYHADGSVSGEGEYDHGICKVSGNVRSESPSSEPFPADAADNVWKAVFYSENGKSYVGMKYFTKEGDPVTSDGADVPERPEGVPELASYTQQWGNWVKGEIEIGTNRRVGSWRRWTQDGQLTQEEEFTALGVPVSRVDYSDGEISGRRTFHDNGERAEWDYYRDDGTLMTQERKDVKGRETYHARWSREGELREERKSVYEGEELVSRVEIEKELQKLSATWKNDQLIVTLYRDDGKTREAEGPIVDGCLVGTWSLFDEKEAVRSTFDLSDYQIEAEPLHERLPYRIMEGAYYHFQKDAVPVPELEGVDAVDWEEVETCYGGAKGFADYLRGLALPEPYARSYALGQIYRQIEHQNSVYEATARVIPFLIALLSHENTDTFSIIDMLYDVGSCAAPYADEAEEWGEEGFCITGTLDALGSGWPAIWAQMPEASTELKERIVLLAQFPSDPEQSIVSSLKEMARSEKDPAMRACAIEALALRNDTEVSDLVEFFGDESLLVRVSTAITCGCMNGPHSPDEVIAILGDGIKNWRDLAEDYWALPFVESHVLSMLALAAGSIKGDARDFLPTLRAGIDEVDGVSATTYGRGLLALTFGPCKPPFAADFIETIRTLAESKQFFCFNVNAHEILDQWALPWEPEDLLALVTKLEAAEDAEKALLEVMYEGREDEDDDEDDEDDED